jgi:UDP-N-acetylmuramoyl-L-alanyl-D-glutamate--2,6-diaminopimelate ligase
MSKIKELFKDIDCKLIGLTPDFSIGGLCCDSRAVKSGDLFIAVKGCEQDGHDYIKEAIKRGATAICSTRLPKDLKDAEKARFIIVNDTAKILPILASRFFGEPAKFLKLIGITGTNGKTTTSYLVYEILKSAKKSPSLLGTIQYRIGNEGVDSSNTTPGPLPLHSLFRQMKKGGNDYVVMEVSSHALKQGRVTGIGFKIAALTNITGDHLDYHRTMGDYVKSKRLLFESLKNDSFAVLNSDDKFYNEFIKSTRGKLISYGIDKDADFKATNIELDINGSQFVINTPKGTIDVKTSLIGLHNIYNILTAASISFAAGIEFKVIGDAIARFNHVPGRLESVNAGQYFKVFIDYAHTHDALERVLFILKKLCSGKIIVVFGCGGNRDRTKRPKMGKIASSFADYVILTDDNPRKENPDTILSEIEKGFRRGFKSYKKIPDRFKAIEEALVNREPSDIVVIAGKGHEDYQIVGDRKFPFNDKKAVREILARNFKENALVAVK